MKHYRFVVIISLLLAVALLSCQSEEVIQTTTPAPKAEETIVKSTQRLGVNQVIGKSYFSQDEQSRNSKMFLLYDLSGIIANQREWRMPLEKAAFSVVQIDQEGSFYTLNLPLQPNGEYHDVDNNGQMDTGVKIFTYLLADDFGDAFYANGLWLENGWPLADIALHFDGKRGNQIESGQLLIWAPDSEQSFPTGFGEDGLLFTKDDPVEKVDTGYTAIVIEKGELLRDRSSVVEVMIENPLDQKQFDLSKSSDSSAFDQVISLMKAYYPDWDEESGNPDLARINTNLREKFEDAVKSENEIEIKKGYGELIGLFSDAMISYNDGSNYHQLIYETFPADYGFFVESVEDGTVRVVDRYKNSPAEQAGLALGDIIKEVNGIPVNKALVEQPVYFVSSKSPITTRRYQELYLFRAEPDTGMTLKIVDMKGEENTITLRATHNDTTLLFSLDPIFGEETVSNLPLTASERLNIGVIEFHQISPNEKLALQMFEASLQEFDKNDDQGLIIDLRHLNTTRFLNLAGYFADEAAYLGNLKCMDSSGASISMLPNNEQYEFKTISVIIDDTCSGACELEAMGFQALENATVYGKHPANGSFNYGKQAEIFLPNGDQINFPLCSFTSKMKSSARIYEMMDFPWLKEIQGEFTLLKLEPERIDEVRPDVTLSNSLYSYYDEDVVMNQVFSNTVIATFLPGEPEIKLQPLTTQNIMYRSWDGVYLNYGMSEDDETIFYLHDTKHYDMYGIFEPTDSSGLLPIQMCTKYLYDQKKNLERMTVNFYLDGEQIVPGRVFYDEYWLWQRYAEKVSNRCSLWYIGVEDIPEGHHTIRFEIKTREPIYFEKAHWDPGNYIFDYHILAISENEGEVE